MYKIKRRFICFTISIIIISTIDKLFELTTFAQNREKAIIHVSTRTWRYSKFLKKKKRKQSIFTNIPIKEAEAKCHLRVGVIYMGKKI
jgi:hypothetical protein